MDLVSLSVRENNMNIKNTQFVILSCDSYLESRVRVIRETWAKNINRVFLIDSDLKFSDDLVGYNTPKNYEGIQEKYINFFKNYNFDKFDYYFFTDDDTFVVINNIEKETIPSPEIKFCLCRHLHLSETGMDKWGNNTHYPMNKISGKNTNLPLDYASGGSGFILSKSSCISIKNYLNEIGIEDIPKSAHGDVSIGFWMRSCGIQIIPSNNLWWSTPEVLLENTWEKYNNDGTELTFHYVSSERMVDLNKKYNE